mmetsp:Transcript_27459/g.88180  ORF Transcript_27459/g.88180 Transcript_27459/m.88180 type:complete len:228 (+) Transcript_27459:743-1426(+)
MASDTLWSRVPRAVCRQTTMRDPAATCRWYCGNRCHWPVSVLSGCHSPTTACTVHSGSSSRCRQHSRRWKLACQSATVIHHVPSDTCCPVPTFLPSRRCDSGATRVQDESASDQAPSHSRPRPHGLRTCTSFADLPPTSFTSSARRMPYAWFGMMPRRMASAWREQQTTAPSSSSEFSSVHASSAAPEPLNRGSACSPPMPMREGRPPVRSWSASASEPPIIALKDP